MEPDMFKVLTMICYACWGSLAEAHMGAKVLLVLKSGQGVTKGGLGRRMGITLDTIRKS